MTGPAQQQPTFYRPADVAAMLHCSQWWVKEQARKRRIPYCWIGGSYRFTPEHVAEIARLFEVRPAEPAHRLPIERRPSAQESDVDGCTRSRLVARSPRRARAATADAA